MSKYIITNCPAYRTECEEIFNFLGSEKIFNACLKSAGISCKDITNCPLKRIVDECYKATHEDLVITDDYNKTACEVAEIYGRVGLAQEILQLLGIEECE